MDNHTAADFEPTSAPPSSTLAEVHERFAEWRAAKPHRNSRVPCELWDAALSLRDGMSISAIGKALRLNPTFLAEQARRREPREPFALTSVPPARSEAGTVPRFVEISCPDPLLALPPEMAPFLPRQILEIRFPDGTTVSAAQAAPVDVTHLFGALMAARR